MTDAQINAINQTDETKKFENPYPREDQERIQLWIGRNDVNFIRLIRPKVGTFAAVGGFLWTKLCDALRRNNITDFTQQNEFESFLTNLTIVDTNEYESLKSDSSQWRQHQASTGHISEPGRPSSGSESDTNGKHARKRVKGVRPIPPAE